VRWLSSSRERATFISNQRRKQHGDQEPTIQAAGEHAAMWEHQGDDLGEHQRERTVLLNDLRMHPHQPVSVLDVPDGWITLHDAELLMQEIDSPEPAAPVVSPISSYFPFNQSSTVGNEALFLLEGYRNGKYPPALCSLYYFKPNRSEVRFWWNTSYLQNDELSGK
jgi:hypothetical protein